MYYVDTRYMMEPNAENSYPLSTLVIFEGKKVDNRIRIENIFFNFDSSFMTAKKEDFVNPAYRFDNLDEAIKFSIKELFGNKIYPGTRIR